MLSQLSLGLILCITKINVLCISRGIILCIVLLQDLYMAIAITKVDVGSVKGADLRLSS